MQTPLQMHKKTSAKDTSATLVLTMYILVDMSIQLMSDFAATQPSCALAIRPSCNAGASVLHH